MTQLFTIILNGFFFLAENTAITVTPVTWKGELCVAMVTLDGGVDVRKKIPGFCGAEEEAEVSYTGTRRNMINYSYLLSQI